MTNQSDIPYTLVSIRFSHYVEKIRWVLDLNSTPFREIPLMPVAHFVVSPIYVGLSGKTDGHSTRFSTPIIKGPDGVMSKSTSIAQYLDNKHFDKASSLFKDPKAAELDMYYTNYLGPHTRRLFYYNVLNQPSEIRFLCEKNVGMSQRLLFNGFFSVMRKQIIGSLRVSEKNTKKSIDYIYQEFDKVNDLLKDGRPFILGDQFSMADISFACMGGAITLPTPEEGYGAVLPRLNGPNNTLREVSRDLRDSPAGKWALSLFANHRGKRAVHAKPNLS
ncbi:MAG: glutathione S-transferase family protein [Pseudobacteriovorax sp.]|nr:glutathione S-transferase family protein [Pseudobacteriovorax sp.]